jgi:ribonuclease P protein component
MSPTDRRLTACHLGHFSVLTGVDRSFGMVSSSLPEEAPSEEDLSTEHPSTGSPSRFSSPHGDPGRSAHHALPSATGSCPAIGLIWRIRDRATFVELARRGRRVSSGPLTVVYLAEHRENPLNTGVPGSSISHPRVAFSVPRAVGPAVGRNRIRRRIRSIASELSTSGILTPGAWLFIVRPGAASMEFRELERVVGESVQSLGSCQEVS